MESTQAKTNESIAQIKEITQMIKKQLEESEKYHMKQESSFSLHDADSADRADRFDTADDIANVQEGRDD